MPEIPHRSKQLIIERLVKKESLSFAKTVWAREMKLLNVLTRKYPDEDFWNSIDLGFQLNSLAWFNGEGKNELERLWKVYKFLESQTMPLDKSPNKPILLQDAEIPASKLEPKQLTIFDWVDGDKK